MSRPSRSRRAAYMAMGLSAVIIIGFQFWGLFTWLPSPEPLTPQPAADNPRPVYQEPQYEADGKQICAEEVCWDYPDGSRICGWRYYIAEKCP